MAIVLSSTFDPTKGIVSKRQRADFTPSGGSVVKISCRMIDVEGKLTTQAFKAPSSSDDINRDVAELAIEAEDLITLVDVQEIDTVLATLGGLNDLKMGTVLVYIADPRDATGEVRAIISGAAGAAFACSLKRADAAIRIGGNEFSKTSLILRNLSGAKLVWSAAGDAPDTVA
jgi:hypothetical protein